MTKRELRALESRVLKRIRRELADVPDGTSFKLGDRKFRWSGKHIEIQCIDVPHEEEEYSQLVYQYLTLTQIKALIAEFKKCLKSEDDRAERRRIKALMKWVSQ
ncbi:MAG: hypothetical protein NTY61_00210 [Candidatus Parcubacteria bacterium]|nr:hypothetical protein [Candidatus Parcubacteria bacterium]